MNLSAAGLALLMKSEGFRATLYKDVAGFATIGYGHRVTSTDPDFSGGITEEYARDLLEQDVSLAEQQVEHMVTVPLAQGQFDALVDFTFNLGAGRLGSSTLLKLLNQGDYAGAAAQLVRWDRAGGQELEALKARRLAELALWNGTPEPA